MTIPLPGDIRKAAHDATTLPFAQAIETSPYALVDIALDAAWPLIAAAERDRIVALLDAWECPCHERDCTRYETRDNIAALIEENPT